MFLRILNYLILSVSFGFGEHLVTYPIADGSDQLSFYRAPFQKRDDTLPQRNALVFFPQTAQNFQFVVPNDIQFAQSVVQPLVGSPTRYAGT